MQDQRTYRFVQNKDLWAQKDTLFVQNGNSVAKDVTLNRL